MVDMVEMVDKNGSMIKTFARASYTFILLAMLFVVAAAPFDAGW